MLTRRMIATFLVAGAAVTVGGPAMGQGKVVVYTSNDSNLNRFVFEAFKKETGIEVEPVEAGSGVVFRRVASEHERPLGDIVWGVSRTLLRANKALLAPYASKNKDAVPADFRDPDDLWLGTNVHLLVILQNTKLIPADAGPKSWDDLLDPKWKGKIAFTDPANSGSAYSNLTMLAQLWGNGDAGWDKVGEPARQHQGAQPLEPGVPGRRQRRIRARHVARICRLSVVLERRAREGDLSGRRHRRADGRRRHHQGRAEHRERQAVRRLRHAQGRAREDPGLRVPPRRARQDLDLSKLPGRCRSSPTSSSSTTTRTPGSRSAPKPRRRSRTSSGARAERSQAQMRPA